MIITKQIKLDMTERGIVPPVHAVQFDANTRAVKATLTVSGAAWTPPADAAVSVAFHNLHTGHKGRYDTLPDGSAACSASGSTVTAILAPAVLAAAGDVVAAIVFEDADLNQLATFGFCVMVEANPAAGQPVTDDYYNYAPGNIDDSVVGTKAWSSKRIMEELAVVESSASIVCEASGRLIPVTDASDRPFTLSMSGDADEARVWVYSKNLLDTDAMLNKNLVKNDDGSYTVTRTGTTSQDRFSEWFSVNLPAGNYTASATLVDTNAVGTSYLYLYVKYADGTTAYDKILQQGWSLKTLTFAKDVVALLVMISGSQAVGTYCTFRDLQLEAGSAQTPYEAYRKPQSVTVSAETPVSLSGYKPNTTVLSDSTVTVSYVADTKTYIDNKFAELRNAILSTGANI